MRHFRRSLGLPLLLLLALPAERAFASGVGLRWDACVADGGVSNRSFACNTNTGALFLISSFALDQPLTSVKLVDISLELASASTTLPAWWDLSACRSTAISIAPIVTVACAPSPGAQGIIGVVLGEHGPNTERIELGVAGNFNLSAGKEYLAVPLRLSLSKTTGTGSCGGCDVPVCIVVRSVSFTHVLGQPPDVALYQPLNGTDANYVTWQGGGTPVVGGATGCPAATPVHRTVWGSLKALYR